MLFRLAHPAFRTCDDCQRWMYDDNGQLKFVYGTDQPMERPRGVPTPCHSCARCAGSNEKTPEIGRQTELSTKNERTLAIYYQIKACGPAGSMDEITRRNLGAIEEVVMLANHRQQGQAAGLLGEFVGMFRR